MKRFLIDTVKTIVNSGNAQTEISRESEKESTKEYKTQNHSMFCKVTAAALGYSFKQLAISGSAALFFFFLTNKTVEVAVAQALQLRLVLTSSFLSYLFQK